MPKPREGGCTPLDAFDLRGRHVLTRVDFNVPMQAGQVSDNTRIARSVPTIDFIRGRQGIPILMSHLGRPTSASDMRFSLAGLGKEISRLCHARLLFSPDTVGPNASGIIDKAEPGDIVLLENLRFNPGEEANDPEFAARLAQLGDIYCNDAFSACHRSHASIVGIANLLPSCAGKLLTGELNALESALGHPERPVLALIGGAKISSKIHLLQNLVERTDLVIVVGAMANTFLLARGSGMGSSLVEPDMVDTAAAIADSAERNGCQLVLPSDLVIADELRTGITPRTVDIGSIPGGMMALDIGPKTISRIETLLENCRTVIWNGPAGAFEYPPFDAATVKLARKAADLTSNGRILTFAGGGDTVAALVHARASKRFTYLSTAGGAFLEWLEGRVLPGIAALSSAS
ncbi:MAG: phosphoglycerate kinase [Rhodobacteraceae bacterium]|nr:phosphoglycerate kinase [Paracoccaceae bacterium]